MDIKERRENEERSIRARLETIHAWVKAHPLPDRNQRLADVAHMLPSASDFTALLIVAQAAHDAALVRDVCDDLIVGGNGVVG